VNKERVLRQTNLLPTSCTVFYIYYTKLLHVSAIYPRHLQGVTSLVNVYSCTLQPNLYFLEDGQNIWPKHVGALYNKYKTLCNELVVDLCVLNCSMEDVQHQIKSANILYMSRREINPIPGFT
jgi:hypothetical protein